MRLYSITRLFQGFMLLSTLIGCQTETKVDLRTKLAAGNPEGSFQNFLSGQQENHSPEEFAADLFQSQIRLNANFQQPSKSNSGRCLLLLTDPDLRQSEKTEMIELANLDDWDRGEMTVSDSGLLLYSEPNQQAEGCSKLMSETLKDDYDVNIDNLYISFYRY